MAEVIGVALSGLAARKVRTALILLGPVLGAAAIIAAIGLSESAKGDLQRRLRELGTNLIIVEASSAFTQGVPTLPDETALRLDRVSSVERSATVAEIPGLTVLPTRAGADFYRPLPALVRATDPTLTEAMDVGMASGRFLNGFDQDKNVRTAVLGADLGQAYEVLPGEVRTILIEDQVYAVVGVLETIDLVPAFNTAVFIPFSTAEQDFGIEPDPTQAVVRADPDRVRQTEAVLPAAIGYGGPGGIVVDVPSDLLEAEASVDETLRNQAIAMGTLALIVGGVGIANVMTISVLQRSAEIGVRRALGHRRWLIATQFLVESMVIGVLGGALGAAVGVGAVAAGARSQDWVFTISWPVVVAAALLALFVAVIAGIYPAIKAARLEPLETLRLG